MTQFINCSVCQGAGRVMVWRGALPAYPYTYVSAPECRMEQCAACGGRGYFQYATVYGNGTGTFTFGSAPQRKDGDA